MSGGATCTDAVSSFTTTFVASPTAQIDLSANTCNAAPDNTVFDFSSLVLSGATDGVWADTDGSGASGAFPILDFSGVAPDSYTFTYTLSADAPCNNAVYTTTVLVENCACPSVATQAPTAALCNSGGSIDLSTLQITAENGTWVVTDAVGNAIALDGTVLDATDLAAGNYTATFTLNTAPPAGCPAASVQTITVSNAVEAGNAPHRAIAMMPQ
ncbi:MAG: hypothetical protein IPL33_07260 [Sphingobacteriales bacterium]|nr:hypothetical protein [Sphingobacteriales bacterium]